MALGAERQMTNGATGLANLATYEDSSFWPVLLAIVASPGTAV
jgi:hypothetical protein